jgi:hypothetical protein
MIGSNIYITNRFTYGSIDPSFKAVLDLAKANNILAPLPGTVVYKALDTMVKSYKAEGVWEEWDTYFQFMYNTPTGSRNFTEFSKIDWRRLITGSYQGGFTFELGGTKGNAANAFFNTNFTPLTQAQKYKVNNASRFLYAYNAGASSSLDGGASAANNNMSLTSTANHRINTTGSLSAGGMSFAGVPAMKSIHRVSTTQVSGSSGGVFLQSRTTSAETLLPSQPQLIHRNATLYGDNTVAMHAMGSSLINKVAIINTIFNQYTASIGI